MNGSYDRFCSKAELELFSAPPLNIGMERGDYVQHQPISSLDAGGPIEFHLPGSVDQYLDLGRTKLYLQAKIVKRDNSTIDQDEPVAPVNLLLHSLFSQVDLKLKDTVVTASVNTYPYKSYIETLLAYGAGAKNGQKTMEGWYGDQNDWGKTNPASTTSSNPGFDMRHKMIARSQSFELMGRLHLDLCMQDRYLIPGLDVSIKLIRNDPKFHLMAATDDYIVKIEKAMLMSRRVKVNPTIALHHEKLLNEGQLIKYPIRRGIVHTCCISMGSLSFHKDNLVSGQLPRRVIIGLVTNSAFNGKIKENPFRFHHHNVSFLSLHNGAQCFPSQPLQPDFRTGLHLTAFEGLVSALGYLQDDRDFNIDRDDYKNGNTLFGFDLTADQCEGAHVDPIQYGNLKIEIHFTTALTQPVNIVAYSEYESCIKIDRARNVITDYQNI